jgi:PKD repeat protein
MSKTLFFLLLSIFSFSATALITDTVNPKELKCSKNGTTIIYVNGVRVSKPEAVEDVKNISKLLENEFLDKPKLANPVLLPKVIYDYSYNTNKSNLLDFVESGAQKLMLEKGMTRDRAWYVIYTAISEGDLSAIPYSSWGITTEDIEALTLPPLEELMRLEITDTNLLKTKFNQYLASDTKVIMISHSQGNLFTNNAFRELQLENPGNTVNGKHFLDYSGMYRNLQISTPANQVLMPGNYITNNYDFIRFIPGALSGNASFIFPNILDDPRGAFSLERQINHSLIYTYLQTHPNFKQLRDRVLQGIVDQASKLESNCTEPPVASFQYVSHAGAEFNPNPMTYDFDGSISTDLDEPDLNDPSPIQPPDFDIDVTKFDWIIDGMDETFELTGMNPTFTFSTEGTYTVQLIVTDLEGNKSKPFSLLINVFNSAPITSFTTSVDGFKAIFDGTLSSDPDGSLNNYAWDFGDGFRGNGLVNNHTYILPGTYPVTLTVTDNNGKSSTMFQNVTIVEAGANFHYTFTDTEVLFDASDTIDPGNNITSYNWEFSDGTSGSGKIFSKKFLTEGTFEVTLTTTDADNNESKKTKFITITFLIYRGMATYTGSITAMVNVERIENTKTLLFSYFAGGTSYDAIWTINGNIVPATINNFASQSVIYTFDLGVTPVTICVNDPITARSGCTLFDVFASFGP